MNYFTSNFKQQVITFATILITLFIFTPDLKASHLVGGNIGYEDLGPDPFNVNNRRFRVYLDAYLDCNSQFWGTSFPEQFISVGFYESVLNPTSTIAYSNDLDLQLIDSNKVDPNLPPICDPYSLFNQLCVYLVRYEGIISIPQSNLGYWVVYDRCCRPPGTVGSNTILNLNNSGSQSFSYTTWIPGQTGGLIPNSSPQFTDTLLSYICRTDTSYISNTAIDPDGDSLVYSLVEPFQGLTSSATPNAPYNSALLDPYSIPPPPVIWAVGFNLGNLLGTTGFSAADPTTGITRFLCNGVAGNYVATVEITEYRNGNIVGVTQRNMQLIADDCPNNNMPNQNTSNLDPSAVTPLDYEVDAGDTICFDLEYNDLDNDPLEFSATSVIFDNTLTNPTATVTSPVSGIGNVTGTICWNTSCAQGRVAPYVVDVVVVDSACPPLPLPQTLHIRVIPFDGPDAINGDSVVCLTNNQSVFTADTLPGVTYNWSVTGGTITAGAGTPAITIDWNNVTTGTISLNTSNIHGCIAGPLTRNVVISNVIADAGTNQVLCPGDTVTIGGTPTSQDPNNTIVWTPSIGLSNPNSANPTANPAATTTYVVSLTNSLGCLGEDSVTVNVNTPIPSGILSDYFVCPGDTLQVNATGVSFLWSPNTFISNPTVASPDIYPPSTTTYMLEYTDANGCQDTDTMEVTVNVTVPTDAGPDATICTGDSVYLGGTPTSPPNTTYLWSPSTNMTSNTDANPGVLPTGTTTYIVMTSNDTCTGIDSVTVTVNNTPALTVSSSTYVCENDSTQLTATGNGTFSWSNGATLSDSTIANPLAFPSVPTVYVVTLTDPSSCEAIDSILVTIQTPPVASAGGTIDVCKFLPTPIGGTPTGPTGSTYLWTPNVGLNSNNLANPLTTVGNDITYIVQVTDTLGCVNYDTLDVSVFRAYGFTDTTICSNVNLQLQTTTNNGNAPYTYQWSNPELLSDSTSAAPFVTTGDVSLYTVTITDVNNCRDTVDFNIDLLTGTSSNFSFEIATNCDGVGVTITDSSMNAANYDWYINGQWVSEDQNPTLVFPYNQDATVMLVTTSVDGCVDTTIANVQGPSFEELLDIEISNIFTPNGDGVNDYFEILSKGDLSNCLDVTVFNRDGLVVYQSSGGIHTWDGRSQTGSIYPSGVYFYIYNVNGFEYHGSVTLLK